MLVSLCFVGVSHVCVLKLFTYLLACLLSVVSRVRDLMYC